MYSHTINGPTTLDEGEMGTWTASANCPDGSPSYTWSVNEGAGWSQIGTGSSVTWGKDLISSTITVNLKVKVAAGGESDSTYLQVIINNNDGGGGCNAATNQICLSAQKKATAIGGRALPDTLQIGEVAPTPTRTRARLEMALPQSREIRVAVYNTLGQRVRQTRTRLSAGWHTVPVDVTGLSSGMYFARITVGATTKTRRIVVVR